MILEDCMATQVGEQIAHEEKVAELIPFDQPTRRWIRRYRFTAHDTGEDGQITLEVLLTIAGVVVPLALIIFAVLAALKPYYSGTDWIVSLPFP